MVRLLVLSFVALGTRAESATTQPFYGAVYGPNRRELQTAVSTTVSTVADLTSTLTNPDIGHIVLAPGTYILSAELSVTRSVIIEAAVAGSVVLNATASGADGNQRSVLNINPGSSGVVQVNGLNITGGYTVEVSAAETSATIPMPFSGVITCFALVHAGRWCLHRVRHSHILRLSSAWQHSWLGARS